MMKGYIVHGAAAYILVTVITAVLHLCGVEAASVWGVGLALLAGGLKEVITAIKTGTFNGGNCVAVIAGCFVSIVILSFLAI